jgi:hypothetical protein
VIFLTSALRVHTYSSLLSTLFLITCVLSAGGIVSPSKGQAQELESRIERQAREAFHGPDLEGKDGPMAKVGLDLARLYYKRERALEEEKLGKGELFKAPASMQTDSGSVVVDAIAVSDSTEALRQSLAGLGAKSLALSGRIVSARLPIGALPQAADLSVLRSMQPARARTHGQLEPSREYDMSSSVGRSEERSGGNSEEKAPGSALGVFLLIGTFLLIERI